MGMPSKPGAMWGDALDRADIISLNVSEGDEDFPAGY